MRNIKIHINKMIMLSALLINITSQAEAIEKHDSEYNLPNRDPGNYQSPINILTLNSEKSRHQYLFKIHFKENITAVENLGHTIQLDFAPGSSISFEKNAYRFKQMHFHTPSEHLIDGITYPMELHIVSVGENTEMPHYVVMSILFKMGKENSFINEFLNEIPQAENSKQTVKKGSIKLKDLLSIADLEKNYHYKGSLTTPPYSETVHWFVVKKIFEASPEQIKRINLIEGNNARHIEPQYNRLIDNY